MSSNARERFSDLDREEFTTLVSSTWREQGWSIQEDAADELPSTFSESVGGPLVPIARSTEQRLVLIVPAADGRLSAPALLDLVSAVDEPSNLTVVAAAGVTVGSLSVADAYGVDVIGPASLARLTEILTAE